MEPCGSLATVAGPATVCKYPAAAMPLANPTPVRLAKDQIQWIDGWRGDTMPRGTAIRVLLEQVIRLHRDGILPATGRK